MPEATYPTPLHSSAYDTGPIYLKYVKHRKDWTKATVIAPFEDGGIDTNTSAANTLQEYELIYDGLSDEDANILDTFWDAHGVNVTFTFIEPRDHPWTGSEGATVTGCRFISYEKNHADVNGVLLIQNRRVVIGKYPS
jgi:hypothetical protein